MTIEEVLHVRVSNEFAPKFSLLNAQAASASDRLAHSPLGDRTELVRYEQIMSEIEAIAYELLGRPDVVIQRVASADTISVSWPFAVGVAVDTGSLGAVSEASSMWRSSNPRASRTDATYERFVGQLERWANPQQDDDPASRRPACPSGVQNRALAEALRKFANSEPGRAPVEAPITYSDGSTARPFPLRSVHLAAHEPDDGRDIMRMTLLSVRHFDMDADVDGAWLRNREISLPRARAMTDELVYQQSLEQFALISAAGPITLHLYQTGLEPANVGFYRALIDHHRHHQGHSVAVVPYYYAGDDYARGSEPWTIL